MYHFLQFKPNAKEAWRLYDERQLSGLEQPPAFMTVLKVDQDPENFAENGEDPLDHVKYMGPMYFDFDGPDLDAVLESVRTVLTHLTKKLDIDKSFILRHGMAPYETDKRSSSLLKVKDFSDAEAIVIAVERGTPNGEFEVPVWTLQMPCGRTFKATAHGNAQQKHAQWEMRHTYMGRPLTYQHFGHSKDGIPLLPVALRWREDV